MKLNRNQKAAEDKRKRRAARKAKAKAQTTPPNFKRVLFKSIVPVEKHSANFKSILLDGYAPALQMMEKCFTKYNDKDGNFIEQFQTTGFDSRTWELYLNAYLLSAEFDLDSSETAPDFCATKNKQKVFIEAVTTSKTEVGALAAIDPDESMETKRKFQAIKIAGVLWTKTQKKYWEKDHVKDSPLILAVECFHEDTPIYWGDAPLIDYLYGKTFTWRYDDKNQLVVENADVTTIELGEKVIPSGYFNLDDTQNISAVIFSNSATVSKFVRMGKQKWLQFPHTVIRTGTMYNHNKNAVMPELFEYVVGSENSPHETWGNGLVMFHNPNAKCPVDALLFPDIPHGYYKEDAFVIQNMPSFHPFGSTTQIIHKRRTEP